MASNKELEGRFRQTVTSLIQLNQQVEHVRTQLQRGTEQQIRLDSQVQLLRDLIGQERAQEIINEILTQTNTLESSDEAI